MGGREGGLGAPSILNTCKGRVVGSVGGGVGALRVGGWRGGGEGGRGGGGEGGFGHTLLVGFVYTRKGGRQGGVGGGVAWGR